MKNLAFLSIAMAFGACGMEEGAGDPGGPLDPEDQLQAPGVPALDEPLSPAQRAEEPDDLLASCRIDGQFDFHVFARDLAAWEGRRVVAAAIENDLVSDVSKRVVFLSSRIDGGGFSLYCPRPLTENYGYPSFGVYVDVDGDGACGTGDAGFQMQLYDWNAEVSQEIGGETGGGWATIPPPGSAGAMGPPIGSSAGDFCAGYFHEL